MFRIGSSLWRMVDRYRGSLTGSETVVNSKCLVAQRGSGNVVPCRLAHIRVDSHLSRDWLAKLWIEDKNMKEFRRQRWPRINKQAESGGRKFSGVSVTEKEPAEGAQPIFKQPPVSQTLTGVLKPSSPEEVKVALLLARSNLIITRDIEWANLVLGFEQESRYIVFDSRNPGLPVGFIREQSNLIARQLLRMRRPFVASITDATGNELFKIRRPFWWITSSIFAEIDGKVVGVVHRRWHLWRRLYDLYLGNRQFAEVINPGFWNWTFTLKDINDKVLAEIDRGWRGFGYELLTDAGTYAIRFGDADNRPMAGRNMIDDLKVVRPLTLSERAVAVALAVSLDSDYFSRHGSWGIPFLAATE